MRKIVLDFEIFQDFVRVVRELGHIPSWREYLKEGNYHPDTIRKHFGSFNRLKEIYKEVYLDGDGNNQGES